MRIQRPQLIKGSIRRKVAIGEKVVVRRLRVYKLPALPKWVAGNGKLTWIEKLINGLLYRGWFKNTDVYLRVDPDEVPTGQLLAFIVPPYRGDRAFVLNGHRAEEILQDAQLFPRSGDGALFVKVSP